MVSELDPIHRHLPASQRPKLNNRHSVFQVSSNIHCRSVNIFVTMLKAIDGGDLIRNLFASQN